MIARKILILLPFLIWMGACKKDKTITEPNPPVSDTPHIAILSISPGTIKQLDEELKFTISYLDGNGDIGFEEADSFGLYLTDQRFPLTEKFHVQPLAPMGSDIAIQGKLIVTLKNVILKDQNAASEQAIFSIKIKDRAGNWSNEVTSAPVTVTK